MTSSPSLAFAGTERFEIRRRLGAGAMGVVYAAYDHDRGVEVALKTMRTTAPEHLYRFKQEFRALAGIAHPNLVTLHELHADDQVWFFTMELVEGVDLVTYVRGPATDPEPGPNTETRTLDTQALGVTPATGEADLDRLRPAIAQLAQGVSALHQAGKLHRDIKPSNILVTDEPRLVLLDFGVIAEIGGGRLRDNVVGTPAYMAPEQAAGRAVPASDWYAVGTVLFQLLTGERPFSGSAGAILYDKAQRDPPPVGMVAPDAPRDLATLCDELLRRDPNARPGADEILARLDVAPRGKARHRRRRVTRDPGPLLVGRDEATAALARALARAQSGTGTQIHVSGESGMGKSALVWSFLRRAEEEQGAVILAGRCYQQESVPYKAVDSMVDTLGQFLADLPRREADAMLPRDIHLLAKVFPTLQGVEVVAGARRRSAPDPEPHELRRRAFAALRELIARVAELKPLVLFIDDLQWGDIDSAPIIETLMRPPDVPAVVLVLAYRSEDLGSSPLLGALLRRRERLGASVDAVEIRVSALTEADAAVLAERLLAGDDAAAALAPAIARESGGVPFFVHELALAARQGLGEGGALSLESVVAARLAELAPAERLIMELIALAAKPVSERGLAHASRLDDAELGRAHARLTEARLVRSASAGDGIQLECYHDRIRESVAGQLTDEQRRNHHVRLAEALAAEPEPDLEALVVHSEGAGDREAAAGYAAEAADQADRALAFDRAAELYTAALELGRWPADRARALRTRLGDALVNAGRGSQAAEAYMTAAQEAAPVERLELMRRAASAYLRSGRLDSGLRVLEQVLADVGAGLPKSPLRSLVGLLAARARLRLRGLRHRNADAGEVDSLDLARLDVLWSSATDLGMVDTLTASKFGTQQLLLALRLGEPSRIARGLTAEAMFLAAQGNRRRTEQVLETAAALVDELDDPELPAWLAAGRGLLDYQCGNFADALASSDECVRHLREECTGVLWETGGVQAQSLWPLFYLGELRELASRVDVLVEQARMRGNHFDETHFCTGLPALAWLVADRPDQGRRELADAMSRWSPRGFHLQHYYELLALCSFDLYQGRPEEAWSRVEGAWRRLRRSKLMFIPSVAIEASHLRARVAIASVGAGGDSRRLAAVRSARRTLRRYRDNRWASAFSSLLDASVAPDPEAVDRFRAAADLCDRAGITPFSPPPRRLAALLAGEETAACDRVMADQGVVAPGRFTELLIPACATSTATSR